MEITEEKLFRAFGLKQGEKDPEAAEPEEHEEPEQEDEDTKDATGGNEAGEPETEDADEEGDAEDEETDDGGETQTKEQRRENAARRRQQERQEAIDAAVREALTKREQEYAEREKAFYLQAGLKNPFTGKPITNRQEFDDWYAERENQNLQRDLKNGKLTTETVDRLIDRRLEERQNAEQEARQQAENEARFQEEVERQMAEIRKKDPAVKVPGDLMNRPYGKKLYEYVQKGNNLEDAFYLATRGQEETFIAEAARQSAAANATGKKHLKPTGIGTKPGANVSEEERKMFKLFNPEASDEAIQKYQNKYNRGKDAR